MDESRKNAPEPDSPRDQDRQAQAPGQQGDDQRGKADQLAGDRVGIRQELGKRAEEAQDPGGSDPEERTPPAREQ